ncbi:MAG: DoxX family membrane protein [Phycisphaeraceae bacterium]|nr:DoxX family membrane protein [Phycisphaeraceae bacterium]MCW5753473.1 DoxX family membrane protein [Phycisphaeraceae bacterium]
MGRVIADILAMVCRWVLGGLLLFAAWHKLQDPQSFAESIRAFKFLPDHLIIVSAFAFPWLEVVAGVCLVLGWWGRAAAVLAGLLLAGFTVAIARVLILGIPVGECGCFGKLKIVCEPAPSICHIIRNVLMMLMALLPVVVGGGYLCLDGLCAGKRRTNATAAYGDPSLSTPVAGKSS